MRIVGTENNSFLKDSLLGGAALSLSDLERVESQEIEWLFTRDNESEFNIEEIAS